MKKLCILAFCLLFAFSSADAAKGIKRAKGGKKGGRKVEKVEKAQREQERIERQTPKGKTEREGMRDELRDGGKSKTPGITDNKIFEGGEKDLSSKKILSEGKGTSKAKGEKKQPGTTSLNRTGRARITMKDTGNEIGMQGAKDLVGDLGKETKATQTNSTVERAIAAAERKTVEAEQAPQAKLPKEFYSDTQELVRDVYNLAEGQGELYRTPHGLEVLVFKLPNEVTHNILGPLDPQVDIIIFLPDVGKGSIQREGFLRGSKKVDHVVTKEEIGSKIYPSINDLGRDLYELAKGQGQIYTDFRGEEVMVLELPSDVRYISSKGGIVSEMVNRPGVRALYHPETNNTRWIGQHYVDNFLVKKSEAEMKQASAPMGAKSLSKGFELASVEEELSARGLAFTIESNRVAESEQAFAVGLLDKQGKIVYAERATLDVLNDWGNRMELQNRLPHLILTARKTMPQAVTLVVDKMERVTTGKTPTEQFPAFRREGYTRNIREYVYNLSDGKEIEIIDTVPWRTNYPRFLVDKQNEISVVDANVLKENKGKLPYLD